MAGYGHWLVGLASMLQPSLGHEKQLPLHLSSKELPLYLCRPMLSPWSSGIKGTADGYVHQKPSKFICTFNWHTVRGLFLLHCITPKNLRDKPVSWTLILYVGDPHVSRDSFRLWMVAFKSAYNQKLAEYHQYKTVTECGLAQVAKSWAPRPQHKVVICR